MEKPSARSLKTGMVLNWLGLGINFLVHFAVTPIIIRHLGSVGFGMWALIQSFSGYYGLINLGLTSALQQFVTKALATDDEAGLQETISTTIAFFACTGTVVLVLATALAAPAARFFEITPSDNSTFAATLILCACSVVADFFGSLTSTLFIARERFDLSNGLNIARQLVQAGAILAVLHYAPSIFGIALAVSGASIVTLIASWHLATRLYPTTRLSWRGGHRACFKRLLGYGTSSVLLRVTSIIRLRVGNIIIAKTAGLAAVTHFSIASNLVLNMNSIVDASLRVLSPRFTRLGAQLDNTELQKLFRMSLFCSSTMGFGMALLTLVFGERFILFWLGQDFLACVPVLKALMLAYAFAFAQAPGWNLMLALAKHHYMTRVGIVEAVLSLIVGLWLSRRFGAMGFAWATAAAMLLSKLLVQPRYTARIAGLSLREYVEPMFLPFGVAVLLFGAANVFHVEQVLRDSGMAVFVFLVFLYIFLFGILIWASCRKRDYMPPLAARGGWKSRLIPSRLGSKL